MEEEIFNRIKDFVEQARWKYNFPLNRNTELRKDLKLAGDDAIEFMLKYAKQFNVDLSRFMAADYFEDEGMNLLFTENRKVLTLGDLERGVIEKKLDEGIINSI